MKGEKERIEELTKEIESLKETLHQKEYSERLFRVIVESIPAGIVITDRNGNIKFVNSRVEKMFGYKKNELIGKPVEILIPQRFRNTHLIYRKDYYSRPQARPMGAGRDLFALRKDGSEFPVEIGLTPISFNGDLMVLSSIVDITERKRIERELIKEREKAQRYLDIADVIIVALNRKGEVELINQKGCRVLGYPEEEIIGKNWFKNFVPQSAREEAEEVFKRILQGEPHSFKYLETPITTRTGQERLIAWHNTVLTDDSGNTVGTLSSGEDITERKQTEKALRESEEKLLAIMNNTTDAILVYDENGNITTMNREAHKLFCGDKRKELKTVWEIIPVEERENFKEILKSVKMGKRLVDHEMEKLLAPDKRITVSIGLVYIDEADGGFVETIRDITERIMLRNKILDIEKAQVVGKMAEGIAHHMGTPLASMLLRVQMLKEDITKVPNHRGFLDKLDSIERQIFYAQKIIQKLLKFVRQPENERRPENVYTLIEEALDMIKPFLSKRGIEFKLHVDKNTKVLADGNLLELVFSDIIMNAVDAMPKGGTILIESSRYDKTVVVRISDTGTGIPRQILPLVFEPFFSTKPAGKGTGLGLAVAKRVIHDHGGEINLDSEEGKGTSVFIKLPVYEEEGKSAQM
ncbi:MAG: hypothetical protein KatS3mg078_1840 [Deltaproteobacteria bacterium]|nr:MAG: hypothetical protein KatS3mg078_1840 [Deltaproteobacteria bacterium]